MVSSLKVIKSAKDLCGPASFSPSGCDPNHRCGEGMEKIYPTCAVRYGYMRYLGEFRYSPNVIFGCGAKVVIQSNRGIEIGEQVSLTCTGCDKSIKRQSMLDYVKNSGPDFYRLKSGRVLRLATEQDLEEERRINAGADEKMQRARELAGRRNLAMKFVACEHLFGGERIIFHFMSESRVDFRDFVRELAHDYHTRIEMHQVGARDEARLVADYEICGRECCCKNFLKTLRPVSMRMAKIQKATLDPSKVSGRCGRLRCCLRYEHEGYESLDKKLPKVGHRVRTDRGVGTVRNRQILTQLLTVQYDEGGSIETIGLEDIVERDLPRLTPEEADRLAGERQDRRDRPRDARGRGGRERREESREVVREDVPEVAPEEAPGEFGNEGEVDWGDSDLAAGPGSSDQSTASPRSEASQPPGPDDRSKRGRRGRRRGRRRRGGGGDGGSERGPGHSPGPPFGDNPPGAS
jgi:cell fate regulator YaaT (PSP1 superfamily)